MDGGRGKSLDGKKDGQHFSVEGSFQTKKCELKTFY